MYAVKLRRQNHSVKLQRITSPVRIKHLANNISIKHVGARGLKGDKGDPGTPGQPIELKFLSDGVTRHEDEVHTIKHNLGTEFLVIKQLVRTSVKYNPNYTGYPNDNVPNPDYVSTTYGDFAFVQSNSIEPLYNSQYRIIDKDTIEIAVTYGHFKDSEIVTHDDGYTIPAQTRDVDMEIGILFAGQAGVKGDKGDNGKDGIGMPTGGGAGQFLAKASAADYDFTFVDIGELGGDKHYTQNFIVSSEILVNHNLNKFPAVTVIDSANEEVEGEIDYIDTNTLIVRFAYAFSGKVICN